MGRIELKLRNAYANSSMYWKSDGIRKIFTVKIWRQTMVFAGDLAFDTYHALSIL